MQGVILAGGLGTRLNPLTLVTNKHLLPIYDKPMIYYPIETLKDMGIREILIVMGKEFASEFSEILGSGREFGVNFTFRIQENNKGGISDALSLAEDFIDCDKFPLILGDNIFLDSFRDDYEEFLKSSAQSKFFVRRVDDPERFGILELDSKGNPNKIVEKPKKPKTNFAVTGLYMFEKSIFDLVNNLKPSKRNELEITDLNNLVIKNSSYSIVDGFWQDAGTFDSLLECAIKIKEYENRKN